jgi:hypothetical protein
VFVGADIVVDEIFEPITATRNRAAVGRRKAQRVVSFFHDRESTFVQRPVVMRAKQRHVAGRGLPAVDPMRQVMPVDVPRAMTTRKRAAAIARIESAS